MTNTTTNTMCLQAGWLTTATHQPSPHCDPRPPGQSIRLLVIHNISLPPGEFGGRWIDALFAGTLDTHAHPSFTSLENMRVSAHCLIRRDGEVVQFVSFDQRAWHAGVSCYQGCAHCNDFSVGIELEGTDTLPYTDIQYQQLAKISQVLIRQYPAITGNITGHRDIAPGRKTDPGDAFDWQRFSRLLAADSSPPVTYGDLSVSNRFFE